MNTTEEEVLFDPTDHSYRGKEGDDLISVTRLIGAIKPPFDADTISAAVAKKRKKEVERLSKENGISQEEVKKSFEEFSRATEQEEVLKEWAQKRDLAAMWGERIHKAIEVAFKEHFIEPGDSIESYYACEVLKMLKSYPVKELERVDRSREFPVAGTKDIRARRKKKGKVVDIFDIKTNDITFDSTKKDQYTGRTKHYDRFLQPPMDHLEDCDFNIYSLQLSLYMYMEEERGNAPGKMGLILCPWKERKTPRIIQVPYMKESARKLLEISHNISASGEKQPDF